MTITLRYVLAIMFSRRLILVRMIYLMNTPVLAIRSIRMLSVSALAGSLSFLILPYKGRMRLTECIPKPLLMLCALLSISTQAADWSCFGSLRFVDRHAVASSCHAACSALTGDSLSACRGASRRYGQCYLNPGSPAKAADCVRLPTGVEITDNSTAGFHFLFNAEPLQHSLNEITWLILASGVVLAFALGFKTGLMR